MQVKTGNNAVLCQETRFLFVTNRLPRARTSNRHFPSVGDHAGVASSIPLLTDSDVQKAHPVPQLATLRPRHHPCTCYWLNTDIYDLNVADPTQSIIWRPGEHGTIPVPVTRD